MNSKIDIAGHMENFEKYAQNFIASTTRDSKPLVVKLEHTRMVLEKAHHIVREENFEPKLARVCLLAALYHDIGRFRQYEQYGTFRDRESCNHAQMSVRVLKKNGWLSTEPGARLILGAIICHNRYALPKHLDAIHTTTCNLVRDADKLDILRVMDEHLATQKPYNPTVVLNLPDSDTISHAVANAVFAGHSAAYTDLQSVNDFRLLLGTWFFDMNFKSSRKLFLKEGHAQNIVSGIGHNEEAQEVRRKLLDLFAREVERPATEQI